MAYRVVTIKDGQVIDVHGTVKATPGKRSPLAVGVFGQSSGGWPMKCDATGVNPDHIADAMAADALNGIHVEYDRSTGAAIYGDAAIRRKHCESLAIADRNGGYSDPQVGGVRKYARDE